MKHKTIEQRGFTLVEVIIVVAILAALTAATLYALAPGDKISSAEEAGLTQILVSRIPAELVQYKLKNKSLTGFKFSDNNISFIQAWPGIKTGTKNKVTVKATQLALEVQISFDTTKLVSLLQEMRHVTVSTKSDNVLVVTYTIG